MQQTFVITKKKDISERNEKELEEKRIAQEKYNLEHADYIAFINQQNKKKQSQKTETPYKYTEEDIEKFIDPYSNQIPKKILKYLKKIKPKVFSPKEDKYKLVKDWRVKWKKKPHLKDKDYEFMKFMYDCHMKKVERSRDAKLKINEANVNGAEFPHGKFLKRIMDVDGVIVNKVEVEGNNDTIVYFKYKGNDIIAVCYGEPLVDRKRYLPTKLIINGVETDVTSKSIKESIRQIKPKVRRVVVVKKKTNS